MQKHLSHPILTPRPIYISVKVYSRTRCDMVGITKQKKKYLGVLDVNVLFFEIKV